MEKEIKRGVEKRAVKGGVEEALEEEIEVVLRWELRK